MRFISLVDEVNWLVWQYARSLGRALHALGHVREECGEVLELTPLPAHELLERHRLRAAALVRRLGHFAAVRDVEDGPSVGLVPARSGVASVEECDHRRATLERTAQHGGLVVQIRGVLLRLVLDLLLVDDLDGLGHGGGHERELVGPQPVLPPPPHPQLLPVRGDRGHLVEGDPRHALELRHDRLEHGADDAPVLVVQVRTLAADLHEEAVLAERHERPLGVDHRGRLDHLRDLLAGETEHVALRHGALLRAGAGIAPVRVVLPFKELTLDIQSNRTS